MKKPIWVLIQLQTNLEQQNIETRNEIYPYLLWPKFKLEQQINWNLPIWILA